MNQPTASREFDCLAYKRQAQLEIYEETKNLSVQERIAYFHERAQSTLMSDWWQAISYRKRIESKNVLR
jgi:hypothetical protein